MRVLLLMSILFSLDGCSYLRGRIADTMDIWRLDGGVGYGLQASVQAGELAHAGVGSSTLYRAGILYNQTFSGHVTEHHFPLSYVNTLLRPNREALHTRAWTDAPPEHRCYWIIPGALNHNTHDVAAVHYFDIEVGLSVAVAGFTVGFSLGEFLDALLGLFKFSDEWRFLDIAQDDLEIERNRRQVYQKRELTTPYVPH